MNDRILHLGLGAFHRAHQADFTQDAGAWRITSVAMRKPALAEKLTAQGGRFSLIIQHPSGPEAKEITAIDRALSLPDAPGDVLDCFTDPAVKIVTLTITEKGYLSDVKTGVPKWQDPALVHDLQNPKRPKTALGVLVHGLQRRLTAGLGGLTVMSCDNLSGNGDVLRAALTAFATRISPDLARWIDATCCFPNTMVDRITPAASAETHALARNLMGWEDAAAVETEPFRQWVIEEQFAGPRPDWDRVGALIVPDVGPFEHMKLRMLNGAHSLLAYLGCAADLPAVRDVMARPEFATVICHHMTCAARTLPPLPGFDAGDYTQALMKRFANPAIDHRCIQIAMDGSQKLPQRIFAPARAAMELGQSTESFALAAAAWLRFLRGISDNGAALAVNDPHAEILRGITTPERLRDIPGFDEHRMLQSPQFTAQVLRFLDDFARQGVAATVADFARLCH